jgi:hypothetical protein
MNICIIYECACGDVSIRACVRVCVSVCYLCVYVCTYVCLFMCVTQCVLGVCVCRYDLFCVGRGACICKSVRRHYLFNERKNNRLKTLDGGNSRGKPLHIREKFNRRSIPSN